VSCAARISHVSITYHGHVALHDVSLEFHRGDFVGVIGPNGAGKTTLLTVINGLGRIRAGKVEILGEHAESRSFGRLRRRIGYVPQRSNIDPRVPISCCEAVLTGRVGRIGLLRQPGPDDHEIVRRVMKQCGIEHLRDRPVGQVSGGEQQKVAFARALCQEPEIMLLDEPTANLDPQAVSELTALIVDVYRRLGLTVVMVTHQFDRLPDVCGRVLMMKAARIVFDGPKAEALDPGRLETLWSTPSDRVDHA